MVTVGAASTKVTVLSVDVDAKDNADPASTAAPALMLAATSPREATPAPDTLSLPAAPPTFATSVPPAVLPANETSLAVKPVTSSLNTTENMIGDVDVGSGCAAA